MINDTIVTMLEYDKLVTMLEYDKWHHSTNVGVHEYIHECSSLLTRGI